MLSGGIDTTGLAGSPRTRRGGVEVRRRQGNTLTPTPRNFRPGSPAGSWSSGPAPGRTSSPLSQSLSCERRRGGCASFHARARRFWSPAGRQPPQRQRPTRPSPLTRWSSSTPSLESALMALCPLGLPRRNCCRREPGSPRRCSLRDRREAGAVRCRTRPPPPGQVSARLRFGSLRVPRLRG